MNKKNKNEETLIEKGYHSLFVLLNGEKKTKTKNATDLKF